MQIPWGSNALNGASVCWDSTRLVNPHIGLFGDTGMGKTHNIRHMIRSLLDSTDHRLRFHIFDAHGDIEIPGESAVRFHESADFGFNPLELNADPEFGGIRKRIQSLITAIKKTSFNLGSRQERALTRLLTGLYRERGFISNDPRTWSLDEVERPTYPTLLDAIEYGRRYLRSLYIGSNQMAVSAFDNLARTTRQIRAKEAGILKLGTSDTDAKERMQNELQAAKERAISIYTEAIMTMTSGDELEEAIEAEGQEEVYRSIIDRLENLYNIGIYRSTPPPLDPRKPVWRYIITSLGQDEKKLFTMTRLETLFTRAIQRGPQQEILDVVILDEAHLYHDKEEDYIINRMVRELRKFGVMMVFATQGLNDQTEALFAGLGTKVLLGSDHIYRRTASTKLGISDSTMDFIVPHRRILVQMKNRGELSTATHKVVLNS